MTNSKRRTWGAVILGIIIVVLGVILGRAIMNPPASSDHPLSVTTAKKLSPDTNETLYTMDLPYSQAKAYNANYGFNLFQLNSVQIKEQQVFLRYQRGDTEYTDKVPKSRVKFVGNTAQGRSYVISDGRHYITHATFTIDPDHSHVYQ